MKSLFSKAITTWVLLIAITPLWAQVEKKREVNKSFNVDSNADFGINNKYGEVHINTWDKNVIELKVTITAEKRSEERALEYLDRVDINISESSNSVTVETEISGSINNRGGEKLTIDYLVNMPKTNNLQLKHAYGSLYLDDIDGDVGLKMSYGNMKVGNLGGETIVKLSYGNGEMESMKDGELSIAYSNMSVEGIGNVDISSQYSNVEIEEAKDVSLSNKYGNFEFESVNSLKGSSKYGKVNISRLYNTLILDLSYGNGVDVRWISRNFKWIEIDASYSGSTLKFEQGFGAELQGYFKYCDLKYDKEEFEFSYVDKESSRSEYKGKIGTGSGTSKIKLNSGYGNVKIGYSTSSGSN